VFNSRVAAVDKEQVTVVNRCLLGMRPPCDPHALVITCTLMCFALASLRYVQGVLCCSLTKEEYTIPFGACVWSTGVAMHPLMKQVLRLCFCGAAKHSSGRHT
jgi:hypothetical protein